MDAGGTAEEELGGAAEAEFLHLLGAEGRDPHLGHPDRQVGQRLDLGQPLGPLVDLPVVPVEREAVHGDGVDVVEHPLLFHVEDELGVDRRDPAQDAGERAVLPPHGLPRENGHAGEHLPLGVDLEVPVGLVVRLVPQLHGLDHTITSRRSRS